MWSEPISIREEIEAVNFVGGCETVNHGRSSFERQYAGRTFCHMFPYASGPSCGMEMAGILGSDSVEKAKNPSHPLPQVSRMARMLVAWFSATNKSNGKVLEKKPSPVEIPFSRTQSSTYWYTKQRNGKVLEKYTTRPVKIPFGRSQSSRPLTTKHRILGPSIASPTLKGRAVI